MLESNRRLQFQSRANKSSRSHAPTLIYLHRRFRTRWEWPALCVCVISQWKLTPSSQAMQNLDSRTSTQGEYKNFPKVKFICGFRIHSYRHDNIDCSQPILIGECTNNLQLCVVKLKLWPFSQFYIFSAQLHTPGISSLIILITHAHDKCKLETLKPGDGEMLISATRRRARCTIDPRKLNM